MWARGDPGLGTTQGALGQVTCGMLGPGQSSVWLGEQAGKRGEEARAGHQGQAGMGRPPEAVSGAGLRPEGPGSPGRFPLGAAGPGPFPGRPPRLPEEQGLGRETGILAGWGAGRPEPGAASPVLVLSLLCAPVTPATLQGGARSC